MKKFLSIILCAVLVFSSTAITINAEEEQPSPSFEWDGDPLVFIQGYSGPALIRDRGLETEEQVWPLKPGNVVSMIAPNVIDIISSVVDYANGDTQPFIDCFREITAELFDNISMQPDGTSKHSLTSYPQYASEASVEYINTEKNGDYLPLTEGEFIEDLSLTIPADQIFIFNTDWRRSHIVNCEHLDSFIDEVLEYTGSDKVDLYGMSHGGQLTATYLYYHGTEGKIDNAVMNSPAIGGTSLVKELLGDKPVNFNLSELARFGSIMLHMEIDLRWLTEKLPEDFLNSMLKSAFNEVLLQYAVNFGSVWDLMSTESYNALRDVYLDPVKNADIIARADKMHYECMPNMSEGLMRARQAGVNISILANYGTHLGSGKKVDSDFIIDTENSSGATVTPFGQRFPENYEQLNTTCSDPTHNHIAPTRTLDASTCFLPENTWFNYEQYHTQTWWDKYTRNLLLELVLTDNLKDVHTDERFPQFEIAQAPPDGIYVRFTNEASGFYNSQSNQLLFRNLAGSTIEIQSITVNGKVVGDLSEEIKLKEGEEFTIGFDPDDGLLTVETEYVVKGIIDSDVYKRTLYFSPVGN